MTPEEKKAFLERIRADRAAKQAAQTPGVTTGPLPRGAITGSPKPPPTTRSPENEAYLERIRADRRAKAGITTGPTQEPAPGITPAEAKIETKKSELTQATAETREARGKLREQLALKYANAPLTDEEKRNKIEAEISAIAEPMYVGGFEGPIRPYGGPAFGIEIPGITPSRIPEGAKAAPGISGPMDVLGVLSPKVEIPKQSEQALIDYPFDDLAFEQSIKALNDADKAQSRASYNAFKKTYDKYRKTFPSISSGGILDMVQKKIQDIPNKQVVFNPVAGGYENPLLRAVQMQGTTGTLYDLDEIQSDYYKEVAKELIPFQTDQLRQQLANKTKTQETRDRFGIVISSKQVPLTQEDIEQEVKRAVSSGQIGGTDIFTDPEKMKQFMKNPQNFATRTWTGGLEFPGGATVESPAMWFVRAATAIPNAIAGAVGFGYGTVTGVQEAREAARDEKYKPKGEGLGVGLASNIAANVAEVGGYGKEFGDIIKYNPNPTINQFEGAAIVAGTVADIIGFGDIAIVAGGAGAIRGAVAAKAATAAAGIKGIDRLSDVISVAAKTGAADYLNSLPLIGRMAEKVSPTDIRVVYGSRLADEIDAADNFAKLYDGYIAKGLSKSDALQAATDDLVKTGLDKSSFFNKTKTLDPDAARKLAEDTVKSVTDYKYYDEVRNATNKWEAGGELTAAEQKLIAPYIRRSSMVSAETSKLLTQLARDIGETAGRVDLNLASQVVRKGLAQGIKNFARFDTAVKQIDDALSTARIKGTQLKALSRNVVASEDVINKTIETYKNSFFYKTVIEPSKQIVKAVYGGNVLDAYELTPEMKKFISKAVSVSRIDNKLIESDATRILELLAENKITLDDLRLLNDLHVEGIALGRAGALPKTALATEGMLAKGAEKVAPSLQLRRTAAQEKRLQEITRNTPVVIGRITNAINNSISPIKNLVTPYQKLLIDDAMREMGSLSNRLKSEFKRINTDAEFAAAYGVTKDSSTEEKIFALARGAYATADEATKAAVSPVFIDELLKSMIFGANKSRLAQAWSPGYDYGMSVLEDTDEFIKLRESLLNSTVKQISDQLEYIADTLDAIVKGNTNQKLKAVSGIEAFAVNKKRLSEVAATVYGRMKANEIKAKALNRVLQETMFELSDTSKIVSQLFTRLDIPGKPSKLLVTPNKLLEAISKNNNLFNQLANRYRENKTVVLPVTVDAKLLTKNFVEFYKEIKKKGTFDKLYEKYKSLEKAKGIDVPSKQDIDKISFAVHIEQNLNDYADILSKKILSTEYVPGGPRTLSPEQIVLEIQDNLDGYSDILSNYRLADMNELGGMREPYPADKINRILYSLIAADIEFPWIDNLISNINKSNVGDLQTLFLQAMDRLGVKTPDNDKIARFLSNLLTSESMKATDADIKALTAGVFERVGSTRGILEDLQITRQKLVESNAVNIGKPYKTFEKLASGKLDINQFTSPALVDEFVKELGLNANYNNMLKELALLSQEARGGNGAAFWTARRIDNLINLAHTTFYNAALYSRPSFHGVNMFSAPLLQSFSTGRVPVIEDVLRGKMPGQSAVKAGQIVFDGSRTANPVVRNRIAAVDKFGNSYTFGQLHDLAISKGLFVTRAKAELSPSFLNDIKELYSKDGILKDYGLNANLFSRDFSGSQFANYTDRVWRMTSVIDALEDGKTLDQAFDAGRKSLYDYNNLTDFEREWIAPYARRVFVFYNFRRQSIGQFMSNLASNPGRVIRQMRLAKETSDIMVGDQNAHDLSFYFDPNFGTSAIALKMRPAQTRNQGEILSTFALPTQDGLNFAASLLSNPVGFLIGSEFPAKQGRSFEGTMAAEMLSPTAKIALAIAGGKPIVSSQKMMKNYIPPEHMVLFSLAGLDDNVIDYFNVKEVDSTDKENSLDGKSFYVDDTNFDLYKRLVVVAETTGVKSAATYYGRLIGSPALQGAYPDSALSFAGITPKSGAQIKEAAQTRAAQEQLKEFGQETESVESYRFR